MGSPINRTNKSALDLNLVNGVTSDAPKVKANNDTLYDYADGLNQQIADHQSSVTLPHADGSVTEVKLADSSVGTSKLKTGSVTETKLADGSVGSAKLKDSNVTEGKIADDAVTTSKLKDRNVTRQKIATGAVGANELDPALLSGTSAGIVQGNLDNHITDYIKHPGFAGTTGGTSTAYTASLSPAISLTAGEGIVFVAHTNSGANPTLNVNGKGAKPIKKPNGNAAVLVSGGLYTARYDGANFILQGEGGYGTAQPSHVLAGETFGNVNGDQIGTMPSNGSQTSTITTQGGTKIVPAGYTPGGTVTASFANLTADNVKEGVNIGDVVGTYNPGPSVGTLYVTGSATNSTSTSTTPTILKSIKFNVPGVFRIEYRITPNGTICRANLKRNSSILFNDASPNTSSFKDCTHDVSVQAGDVVDIELYQDVAGFTSGIQNLNVKSSVTTLCQITLG